MTSLSFTSHNLQNCLPSIFSHSGFLPSAPLCNNAANNIQYNPILVIDEDDDDLIMYEPVKKLKTDVTSSSSLKKTSVDEISSESQSRSKSKRAVPSVLTIPDRDAQWLQKETVEESDPRKRLYKQSSGQGSKSTASCELPNNDRSSALEYQLREKLGSMLDTYALSFTTDSFSWWQKPSANNNVIVIEEDSPAFEHTKSDLHKHTEIVNLDSPVSTDESTLGSHASEAFENEASDRNNSKQNTFEELASQCPILNLQNVPLNLETNNNSDGLNEGSDQSYIKTIASLPSLDVNTCRGQRIKRTLRSIWNPDCIDADIMSDYLARICQITGQNVTNDEKAVKLLIRFEMNVEEIVKEVRKNKAFYKNYFKSDHRMLRSRIPIF